jgi:hypothetical protein
MAIVGIDLNCLNRFGAREIGVFMSQRSSFRPGRFFRQKAVSAIFAAQRSAVIFGKSIYFKMLPNGTKLAG